MECSFTVSVCMLLGNVALTIMLCYMKISVAIDYICRESEDRLSSLSSNTETEVLGIPSPYQLATCEAHGPKIVLHSPCPSVCL